MFTSNTLCNKHIPRLEDITSCILLTGGIHLPSSWGWPWN